MTHYEAGKSFMHFHDFLEWHGLYKTWLKREQLYRELLRQQSLPEQLHRALVAA